MNLANSGKIHGILVSIGPRPKGMSDSLPPVILHEKSQLYHSLFGQNANVSQGNSGKINVTLDGKQFSGTIQQEGNFSQKYQYDLKFSGTAKELPKTK
jgi:hypothetical protein